MKRTKNKSDAYRTLGIDKITAPVKSKGDIKVATVKSNKDLRGGNK